MDIYTLWGIRRGFENDAPELMVAWDEYGVENNNDGYEAAKAKEIALWGDELVASREIRVLVDINDIDAAFRISTIKGEVQK